MWTVDDSTDIYGIENWGSGYFFINYQGHVAIAPHKDRKSSIDVMDLIDEVEYAKDIEFPVLVRFPQILEHRIVEINEAFLGAIQEFQYPGGYQPVFPMKVNQRKEVIEYTITYGKKYNIGLEVGTKAELLAALALGMPKEALIICNGYKDEDYLKLALSITNVNNIILVVDLFEEIFDVIRYARELGVRPKLGMRIKLFSRGSGRWVESGGESAKFGLVTSEALQILRILAEVGLIDMLKMIHFHIGSQITEVRTITTAVTEASRIYAKVVKVTKSIEYLNVGGGLAVDYNGSKTATFSSKNYSLREYANDIVYNIQKICDEEEVPYPTIVSESGRATAAYHSMLIFKIIGKKNSKEAFLKAPTEEDPVQLDDLCSAFKEMNLSNYKEHFHDALQNREDLYNAFNLGNIGLEERAKGETLFWMVCKKAAQFARQAEDESEDFTELRKIVSQKYIGNFSLFQSVPDMWGVNQIFPVMPLHRLREMPCEHGTIVDLTCDSDGEVKVYAGDSEGKEYLELHPLIKDEDYYVGIFLIGAYQDTLGDYHNLLGLANEVHVLVEGEKYKVLHKVKGDTCKVLLDFFKYDTRDYINRILRTCKEKGECIDKKELDQIEAELNKAMGGYTYFTKLNGHTKIKESDDRPCMP
jgi:arginine decarboxylase